ncbi:MAG: hypothetical protein Q8Q33_04130, partial [Chlamydiota bacterium]|nr:hypothetical protein [Chlamydiota bacterium]
MRKGIIFGSIDWLGNCWCTIILLTGMFFSSTLLAWQDGTSKPSKAEVMQKTKRLQMPFIANEGQTDEKVAFYADTFGGTVFVTKDGEIVYSLPQSPVENDSCRLKISDCKTKGTDCKHERFNGADYESLMENYVYPPLYKSLIIDGLKEYQASKNPQSEFNHRDTEIPNLKISNLKSTMRSLSLKEELVGGKI